jgi:glutaminyl-tRNA synthetase
VTFSRNLYIEAEDFMEEPIKKYKRLTPNGMECRLKGAYIIKCTGCVKDEAGNVVEVLAEYDPNSRGGDPADGRKIKGAAIHWVTLTPLWTERFASTTTCSATPTPTRRGRTSWRP